MDLSRGWKSLVGGVRPRTTSKLQWVTDWSFAILCPDGHQKGENRDQLDLGHHKIGYRGYIDWVRWHYLSRLSGIILTPESIDIYMVDPAVIDWKKMQLPGWLSVFAKQKPSHQNGLIGKELQPADCSMDMVWWVLTQIAKAIKLFYFFAVIFSPFGESSSDRKENSGGLTAEMTEWPRRVSTTSINEGTVKRAGGEH